MLCPECHGTGVISCCEGTPRELEKGEVMVMTWAERLAEIEAEVENDS